MKDNIPKNIKCPDCGNDKFDNEASGGGSQNVRCRKCGQLYNDMGPFGFWKIGPKPWNVNDVSLLLKLERIYSDAVKNGTANADIKECLKKTRGRLSYLVPKPLGKRLKKAKAPVFSRADR